MTKVAICRPRFVEPSERKAAALKAIELNPANRPPDFKEEDLDKGEEGEKLSIDITKYWGPSVRLTVSFIDTKDDELKRKLLSHMNAWSTRANVEFVMSDVDPVVRVARFTDAESGGNGGYWSYLGTDVATINKKRPTMNLEGFTLKVSESEFKRVVRHEAGHTLGFPHEHMRKKIIERLDRKKVIDAYKESQGWSEEEVIAQILTPLREGGAHGEVVGTSVTDETSIMCYQIEGELTKDGEPIPGGDDINDRDYRFAAKCYPKPKS
jgi:hypothetical protein